MYVQSVVLTVFTKEY